MHQNLGAFKPNEQLIKNELTRKVSELGKVNKENLRLNQEIATLEDHSETIRKHIKTKDDLFQKMKSKTIKSRDVANKSTQAEDTMDEEVHNDISD